jgi:hypothetical protein
MSPARRLEKSVLLGPALVRRAAARRAKVPEERWMLLQPRAVRQSFVREVLNGGADEATRQEIWMLRQPDVVRESYIREVLEPELGEEGAPISPR